MGAHFAVVTFLDKEDRDPVSHAEAIQDMLRADNGDDAYGGHLGTVLGVDKLSTEFASKAEAEEHIGDAHEKYNSPMLAKYRGKDGTARWMFAGWMPS